MTRAERKEWQAKAHLIVRCYGCDTGVGQGQTIYSEGDGKYICATRLATGAC